MRPRARLLAGLLLAGSLLAGTAVGQTSTSYKLEEHVLNAGGHPQDGDRPTSPGYRVTLDALGDGVAGGHPRSASYVMAGGFLSAYPPPGEVLDLVLLADDRTLVWDAERSVGVYHVYRDVLSALSPSSSGSCEQQGIPGETTTDDDTVPGGDGYFYLVTAANRLGEEGTRGYDDGGTERSADGSCP